MQPKAQNTYSKIDFSDFVLSEDPEDFILLNLNLSSKIQHTFPTIDRCCKFTGKQVEYDGIDNMERISCKMSKEEFSKEYINKRIPVLMTGCQNNWKAKNWTFENLLNRYDLNNYWYTSYSKSENDPWEDQYLNKEAIWNLVNNDYNVKVFHRLDKHMKGWVNNETNWKLDLMDEYSFPYPMSKDLFEDVHVSTDQAYVMVATPGTGKISNMVLVQDT